MAFEDRLDLMKTEVAAFCIILRDVESLIPVDEQIEQLAKLLASHRRFVEGVRKLNSLDSIPVGQTDLPMLQAIFLRQCVPLIGLRNIPKKLITIQLLELRSAVEVKLAWLAEAYVLGGMLNLLKMVSNLDKRGE